MKSFSSLGKLATSVGVSEDWWEERGRLVEKWVKDLWMHEERRSHALAAARMWGR